MMDEIIEERLDDRLWLLSMEEVLDEEDPDEDDSVEL